MWHLDHLDAHVRTQELLSEAESVRLQRAILADRGPGSTRRVLRSGRRAAGRIIVEAGLTIAGAHDTDRS